MKFDKSKWKELDINDEIINYVESVQSYPIDYKGKRDYNWIKNLSWDEKVKFDENGNLVTK